MIIKGMLKFSLPALLLVASSSAFAADESPAVAGPITLADNKTTVNWEQFANAINNPDDVTGLIADLSDNNSAKRALKTANENLSKATTALDSLTKAQGAAKTAKEKADSIVTVAQGAVTTAEGNLTKAQKDSADLVAAAQKQLDDAKEQLASYESSKASLETQKAGYETRRETLDGQLTTLNNNLRSYRVQLAGLAKVTETKTGTVSWLEKIGNFASDFKTDYDKAAAQRPETPWMYYWKDYNEDDEGTTLYLSFDTVKPSVSGTWLKVNPKNFRSTITNSSAGPVEYVHIYMGSEYAALNNGNAYYTLGSYQGVKTYILQLAVTTLTETLPGLPKYQTTTTTVTDKYVNQAAADEIQGYIDDTLDDIAALNKQINGVHKDSEGNLPEGETEVVDGLVDLIKQAGEDIEDLQGKIDELNNTTIPAKEADVKAAEENETTNKAILEARSALASAQGTLEEMKTAADEAQTDLTDATTAVTTATNNLPSLQQAVSNATATAQDAADALALSYYTTGVTLTEDITATTPITTMTSYTGTIYGAGHIINVDITDGSQNALFKDFSGKVVDAAINGVFGQSYQSGTYEDVVTWNGESGRVYDEDGKVNYTDFGQLGFAIRDNQYFGVNFTTGKLVAASAAPSKVFDITVNNISGGQKSDKQSYVQKVNGGLIDKANAAVTIPVNRFAFSATDDLEGINNVYYANGNSYLCDNVVIEDKVDNKSADFYCPVAVTAANVQLLRTFVAGHNTVCLPFELAYSDGMTAICNYDRVTPDKFWFTKINESGSLDANTPGLVITTKAINNLEIANVAIAPTDIKQYVKVAANEKGSDSYGTFKQLNAGEFKGESQIPFIYGLNTSGKFQAGSSSANFPAFRMIIATEQSASTQQAVRQRSLAPGIIDEKGIGILDENGIEITDQITTGIEGATADALSFSVVGGQNEIIFTSDADYGKVEVYSVNGGVVAIADVIAGTTSVNVNSGIYIVMGQKVLVK